MIRRGSRLARALLRLSLASALTGGFDFHLLTGGVRLRMRCPSVSTLHLAYSEAPLAPARVTQGPWARFCSQNVNPSTCGTLVAMRNRVPLLHRNADLMLPRKVGIEVDSATAFLSKRPIKRAQEQSKSISTTEVMSDVYLLTGGVQLRVHCPSVSRLQLA